MDDRTPVIVAARRTPIGRRRGSLSGVHPLDLLVTAHAAALDSAGVDGADVDMVLTGCVTAIGEQAYDIGRSAVLAGGLPKEVPAVTLDAQCGSSQQALHLAADAVRAGSADIVIASGVESMSRIPLGSDRELGPGDPLGESYRDRYEVVTAGESAERIAEQWKVTREQCDEFGWNSHRKALVAQAEGWFDAEIAPVVLGDGTVVDRDEGVRRSTLDDLRSLKPSFRDGGFHTAGTSSQISDGAAAVVVTTTAEAERRGIAPLARVEAKSFVGVDPTIRLTGPIPATHRVLAQAGLAIDDVDLVEINEAFASVVLAWLHELGRTPDQVNEAGGAIALGHPVGATGARLVTTAVHALARTGRRRALVTMCTGGGMGTGTLLVRTDPPVRRARLSIGAARS